MGMEALLKKFFVVIGFTLTPPRINRTDYIIKYFYLTLLAMIFGVGLTVGYLYPPVLPGSPVYYVIGYTIAALIVETILFINIILITIRRLHDFNFSGWWLLVFFIGLPLIFGILTLLFYNIEWWSVYQIVSIILSLLICLIPGSKGKNRFGAATPSPSRVRSVFAGILFCIPLLFYISLVCFIFSSNYIYFG